MIGEMTVAEVIEQLQKMPQDLPVVIRHQEWGDPEDSVGYEVENESFEIKQTKVSGPKDDQWTKTVPAVVFE